MIWVLHRPSQASLFDSMFVMRGGRIVESGTYDELDKPETHLAELLAAE